MGRERRAMAVRRRVLFGLVLAVAVVLAKKGEKEDKPVTVDIQTACPDFNNTGCNLKQYFMRYLGPQMSECKPLFEMQSFVTWLGEMGDNFQNATAREKLFSKLTNRLLIFGDANMLNCDSELGESKSATVLPIAGSVKEHHDGKTSFVPANSATAAVENVVSAEGRKSEETCRDLDSECGRHIAEEGNTFCLEQKARHECAKTCGECLTQGEDPLDNCRDFYPEKDCKEIAMVAGCKDVKGKTMCRRPCRQCNAAGGDQKGDNLCDEPVCQVPSSFTPSEKQCWANAEKPVATYKRGLTACLGPAEKALHNAKAKVLTNKIQTFVTSDKSGWMCEQIAMGSELGYVCSKRDTDTAREVICKGMHVMSKARSCRRGSLRNTGVTKWGQDIEMAYDIASRIPTKQLVCARGNNKKQGQGLRIGEGEGSYINKENGKDTNKSADSNEIKTCEVRKVLSCANAHCLRTQCTGACETKLLHF